MSLNSGRTVQYKHDAQSLRPFGLHGDVNDGHRAGANRLQNKQTLHGMCGSMETELEVHRTIKRLTAFLCLLKKVMSATKDFLIGYGKEQENASIRKLAMLTCGAKFGKSCIFQRRKKYRWKWSMSKRTAQRRTRTNVAF